jgi:hypothetical protein
MNLMSHSRLRVSKNRDMSASRIQLILRALIPYASAFSAFVLSASGPQPIAKPQKLRLVDRREDRNHGSLDDLVFQGRVPSGRCLPSALRIYRRRDGKARYAPE